MLNVNQKTMEHYRVVKDTKDSRYYFVSADLIKKVYIEPERFEILKENNPIARQMLDESEGAPIIDFANLVCESEHYLYYASFGQYFWDWEVIEK